MDLQEADEQHSLFQVNVIYVEAGFSWCSNYFWHDNHIRVGNNGILL